MRAVDDVVLAELRSIAAFGDDQVFDGEVTVDNSTNKVIYPLPFVVFRSNTGDDDNRRLGGRRMRRSVFFDLTFVGEDRNQVKAAVELVRPRFERRRFVIPGYRSWPCELLTSTRIFRDDDIMRPDGSPVFHCNEEYDISIALT